MKKTIFLLVLVATTFIACEHNVVAPESLYLTESEADKILSDENAKFLTINQLLDEYMTEEGNFQNWSKKPNVDKKNDHPYRTRATNDGKIFVFSIDTLPVEGPNLYIRGRVITEDQAGNFYKSMVIQQIVNGEQQALRLSVDASSLSGQYAIGQELLIKVNGLAIGRYANQPQLCVPSYNNNIHANKAEEKVGWLPGRIPAAQFVKATQLIGVPDKSKIQVDTISIADILNLSLDAQKIIRQWDGKLVCLKDVYFTGEQENNGNLSKLGTMDPTIFDKDNDANVFAPSTGGVGFPRARVISDGINHTLVANSEYVKFAHYYLPGCDANGVSGASDYIGTVIGVLGYYRDNPKYDADEWDWSITPRSLAFMGWGTENDLQFKDKKGHDWVPQEYKAK